MSEKFVELRKEFLTKLYKSTPSEQTSRSEKETWLEEKSKYLGEMTRELNEIQDQIAPYDRRVCMEQLVDLTRRLQQIRHDILPRQPFRFQRALHVKSSQKPVKNITVNAEAPEVYFENDTLYLANLKNQNIGDNVIPYPNNKAVKVSAKSLRSCNISISNCSSVNLHNATKCNFTFPTIQGSIHLSDINDSTICVSCHQFRLHHSTNLRVHLRCKTSPVIEESKEISFSYKDEHPILDFTWARSDPSPHFRITSDPFDA